MTDQTNSNTLVLSASGLQSAPSKLSKLLCIARTRGFSGTVRHVRAVGLHRLHEHFHDARISRAEAMPTSGKRELDTLTIASTRRTDGVHYLATPRLVLDWIRAALPADVERFTLLDIGAGRGRVLMWASRQGFGHVHGIEFAEELAAEARRNIAAWSAANPSLVPITLSRADATESELPATPLVVFLFNPFGADTMEAFLNNLEASLTQAPREVIIVYLNPRHPEVFADSAIWTMQAIPFAARVKFAAACPYQVSVFSNRARARKDWMVWQRIEKLATAWLPKARILLPARTDPRAGAGAAVSDDHPCRDRTNTDASECGVGSRQGA